jgi:hypothetical protein
MRKPKESPVFDQRPKVLSHLRSQLRLGRSADGDRLRAMAINDLDDQFIKSAIRKFALERARNGGRTTRDRYGTEYYSWLSQSRRRRSGWPKGKPRTKAPAQAALETIEKLGLRPETKEMFEAMIAVCTPGFKK